MPNTPTLANEAKLEVSVGTAPATNDKAGYEALTWVNVDEVISLPEFSGTRSNITFNSVTNGQKQFSGLVQQVQATVDCADEPQDMGQTMLNSAFGDNSTVYLRATYKNTRIVALTATIAKSAVSGGFDAVVQRSYTVNVTTDPVEYLSTT